MENFKVLTHVRFGRVRTVELENAPYFVGKDIASILGYAKPDGFVRAHVDEEDKQRLMVPAFDFLSHRQGVVINARGVDCLLNAASSPSAPAIRTWLLGEKEEVASAPVQSHVIEIEGVRCIFDDQNNIHLNAEDVARGLGFVDYQVSATFGGKKKGAFGGKTYEVIRWSRVNEYLEEFGFKSVGKDDYICETAFYLLAMKARNKEAKNFQWKVANVILPSISKDGYYVSTKNALQSEEVTTLTERMQKQIAKPCTDLAVVYCLLMSNVTVKIGMTKDLSERIKQIEMESGLKVWNFASTRFMPREDAAALEMKLKEKYAADCLGGEFFDVRFLDVAAQL